MSQPYPDAHDQPSPQPEESDEPTGGVPDAPTPDEARMPISATLQVAPAPVVLHRDIPLGRCGH